MTRKAFVVLLGLVLLGLGAVTLQVFRAEPSGEDMARADIASGSPSYKLYGELLPDEPQAVERFDREHGITLERIGGCDILDADREFADAYNRVIVEHYGIRPPP
jgi:hypothetical protein